ncbi:hypothetical protein EJ06DRAFT_560353 [Trichodelitschia bisporula]|uniref:Uncharacterized protein n=1 Tax=Trichodelitschia bisporula TaxID=703511 RepID=A0A6G1HJ67_9PEZI|nr:hypothetical protein EJ06DRAFT_560353 [Trichodelitschia bisporula]
MSYNQLVGIAVYLPTDSIASNQLHFATRDRFKAALQTGSLSDLRSVLESMRTSPDEILNRPSAWQYWDSGLNSMVTAYNAGYWHVIEYLAAQPEFNIVPPYWCRCENLTHHVARRAVETGETHELQRLVDLGWDVSAIGDQAWCSPALSLVTSNGTIVRWFLSQGVDPNVAGNSGDSAMVYAAREASLSSLVHLSIAGGRVEGTDLVAQAAIGHSWGRPGRFEVIEWLLERGAGIDVMAKESWKKPEEVEETMESTYGPIVLTFDHFLEADGGQTAFNVARIWGDRELEGFLLARGADPQIEAVRKEKILEFSRY